MKSVRTQVWDWLESPIWTSIGLKTDHHPRNQIFIKFEHMSSTECRLIIHDQIRNGRYHFSTSPDFKETK